MLWLAAFAITFAIAIGLATTALLMQPAMPASGSEG